MPDEIKTVIDELGRTFEEFKSTVDQRIEKMSKGAGVADIEEKLEKMNQRFDELEAVKSELEELQKKGNRLRGLSDDAIVSEHRDAFDGFMRKGIDDGLAELQQKAVQVGVDSDGGYAVPEELDTAIGQLERDGTPMRQICGQRTVSNEQYKKLFSLGGAGSGWVGETDARPETNSPTLAEVLPKFGEVYANPATTQRALDDIFFDVGAWLAEEVALEFSEQENLAFTSGNGTNKPQGFLASPMATTADGSRPFGTIQYRATGTDAALGANDAAAVDNLIDLTYDLKSGYRNQARWVLGRDMLRAIRKLRDSNGDLIWTPGLANGEASTILGFQFTENEDMPAAAAGSNSIAFGDFRRGYIVYDVRGTRVLRDPFTNKPYVHFYTTKRVGGIVNDSQAIKVLRLSV